jgi:hypothetical protein
LNLAFPDFPAPRDYLQGEDSEGFHLNRTDAAHYIWPKQPHIGDFPSGVSGKYCRNTAVSQNPNDRSPPTRPIVPPWQPVSRTIRLRELEAAASDNDSGGDVLAGYVLLIATFRARTGGSPFTNWQEAIMAKSVNVLALVRDAHRFVFLYDDNSVDTILATLSEYANDPELEFTWYDAAMLSQRVRGLIEQQQLEEKMEKYPHAS